jgi:hypothetical protein
MLINQLKIKDLILHGAVLAPDSDAKGFHATPLE